MLRRTLIVFLLSVLLIILISALVPTFQPITSAQDSDRPVSGWCTIAEAELRTCPYWHDCDVRLTYGPNTLLIVRDITTGDRDYGSDLWLVVADPVQGIEGYIHSTRARECSPQPWQLLNSHLTPRSIFSNTRAAFSLLSTHEQTPRARRNPAASGSKNSLCTSFIRL